EHRPARTLRAGRGRLCLGNGRERREHGDRNGFSSSHHGGDYRRTIAKAIMRYSEFAAVKASDLDKNWHELMFLCDKEEEFGRDGGHPKLLAHIRSEIERLAGAMGFSLAQIRTRQ